MSFTITTSDLADMKIGNWDLAQDILIVAEIGNNHEGSYALAEEMIGLAARAGVGAVKLQAIWRAFTSIPNRVELLRYCIWKASHCASST